jgi:hypothetical protein
MEMKKHRNLIVAVVVALVLGLVIGSKTTLHYLPPDQVNKVNLLGKGEDLGTIRMMVEKTNTGGICGQLITAADGEPVIALISSTGRFPKETVTAHLVRREGGSLELVWKD